jgi:hypothetical protein
VPGRKQVIGLLRQAKVELALASGSARSAALWGTRNRATTAGAVSTAVTPDTLVKSGVLAPAHRYTGTGVRLRSILMRDSMTGYERGFVLPCTPHLSRPYQR